MNTVPEHGTRQRYQRGCHCTACCKSNTLYQREYRKSWMVAHRPDGERIRYREPSLPGMAGF
jgi:hypothetical protein